SGPVVPLGTVGPLQHIESGSVQKMVDGSSVELLREMNEKRKKARIFPVAVIMSVLGTLLLFAISMPIWVPVLFGVVAAGLCWLAYMKDELRKTTVIFYDLEPEIEAAYGKLHAAFGAVRSCARSWHIGARADVRDRKYHAG